MTENYQKTIEILSENGFYLDGDIIMKGRNGVLGCVRDEGGVCISYENTAISERLDLHDFCEKQGLEYEVHDIEKIRDALNRQIKGKQKLVDRLNNKIGDNQ